ncbi:hypothetical protein P4O66_002769 [Electrophorus voltai]|uniref:DNA-binding protein SATB n=1 Tax=Electrophorus voltai TaxID=2609070 RepID=A0AAD8YTZ9_9TELE|nr:hypothetical protein P4O66_002769 [Electrophorus voltai]
MGKWKEVWEMEEERKPESYSDVELENMVAKRNCEILCLREEVQRLQLTLQAAQENTANHISCLQQQLVNKMEDIELSVPASGRAGLAAQGGLLSPSPPDDDSVVPNVTGIEIKKEVETSSRPCYSTEWIGALNNPTHTICATPPLVRPHSPSCLSTHDALPCLCMKTKSFGSFRVDGCGEWENDLVSVWGSLYRGNSDWGGWAKSGSTEEEKFSEDVRNQTDTARITQQVRDLLQKHYISQGVFGHYVLGLLQESAIEFLAHPKPWRELTTREKESFLRMINFLSDDQNFLALRMIQDRQQDDETRAGQGSSTNNGTHGDNDVGRRSEDVIKGMLEQARQKDHLDLASESYKENWQPAPVQDGQNCGECLSLDFPDLSSSTDIQQLVPQSLDLDTLSISRRVKDMLSENNLGQRLFGEKVLGLRQGSVSDLLARPKPWSELSPKGREPFIRMSLWLQDPQNVHCLKAMKRTSDRGFMLSDDLGLCIMATRPRVVLTSREKEILNRAYQLEPYPSHHTTHRLALQLGLQTSTVTNWFYNHRSRIRRTVQEGRSEVVIQNNSSNPGSFFYSSSPCMDTSPMSIKQEPSDAGISELVGYYENYRNIGSFGFEGKECGFRMARCFYWS